MRKERKWQNKANFHILSINYLIKAQQFEEKNIEAGISETGVSPYSKMNSKVTFLDVMMTIS